MSASDIYQEDLAACIAGVPHPEKLRGKSFLISGATGMLGSFMVDVLLKLNHEQDYGITVCAMGRSREKAQRRLAGAWGDTAFHFVEHNVSRPLPTGLPAADYIVHLASTSHPVDYAAYPIETVTSNVLGALHLLEHAAAHPETRFLMASSVAIYGKNRGDTVDFYEDYCGELRCDTVLSTYPASKRLCETLCHAYASERGVDCVIARPARSYGPTMTETDSKALAEFVRMALTQGEVVMKSAGTQCVSYSHATDTVSGLLTVLLEGRSGQAYNVTGEGADLTLRDLADEIGAICHVPVRFAEPTETERAGFSQQVRGTLSKDKLRSLGWVSQYDIHSGLHRVIEVMRTRFQASPTKTN